MVYFPVLPDALHVKIRPVDSLATLFELEKRPHKVRRFVHRTIPKRKHLCIRLRNPRRNVLSGSGFVIKMKQFSHLIVT
ncbi:hypothetical protein DLM76_03120 [Leptospira yasudae]|nr:hypothetical protein DLM76_03120 [Leptospira yasudae]